MYHHMHTSTIIKFVMNYGVIKYLNLPDYIYIYISLYYIYIYRDYSYIYIYTVIIVIYICIRIYRDYSSLPDDVIVMLALYTLGK